MLGAFCAFLAVFSVLSLVVHLDLLGSVFGMSALSLFVIGKLIALFAKSPRSERILSR
jgi:hypothetical protein